MTISSRQKQCYPYTGPALGLFALAIMMLSSTAWSANENIGRVLASVGDFQAIQADNSTRQLKRRSPVHEQETLTTGAEAYGQVRFSDGSLLEIKANSRFRIEEYSYDEKKSGGESATFNLIKGAMRTVTGAIGKQNREQYKVKTAIATIGLRGTHWGLRLCENGECRDSNGNPLPDGLYGGVINGAVIVKTNAGEEVYRAGMFFHVSGPDALPVLLPEPPGIVFSGKRSDNGSGGSEFGFYSKGPLPEIPWKGPGMEPDYRSTDQGVPSRIINQGSNDLMPGYN
ncbi:MAG: FecR family protein [Candidatus Sedimenticola sp. 20ELBAFRAG]